MGNRTTIARQLSEKRERLSLYLAQEKEILTGGAKAYALGSRSLQRYDTALGDVKNMIKTLEDEILQLENQLTGRPKRLAQGVIPRDW